ncbi:peroxisomal sarcosine oxidase [Podospora fimiseda]|uniref:Peroxisomal sarcosine oxidase n=1 Tax=Podospora fimiseda TaxID=252190 RepID=A0AAN7GTS3_9PEZI|nr:peroxisomal sarcosine oxidase [Podospora fimiseda]
MSTTTNYDVIVIGGGPVGLAATYEVAKAVRKVLVLKQNNFYNQAEDFMAVLAKESMDVWDELEKDAGESLRWMSGLLNFGDPTLGEGSPEVTVDKIQQRWPFKDLPSSYEGLYAPDNGVINVPPLVRTLSRLTKDYGADAQRTKVNGISFDTSNNLWNVSGIRHGKDNTSYHASKIIIANGAYVSHVLKPSFGLDIWEITSSYFNINAGPKGTIFPSMWFQFAPDVNDRLRLFYGFPAVPWGPPNVVRIAVDAATRRITDSDQRAACEINAEDIEDTRNFVRDHIAGADASAPVFNSTCLQTNISAMRFVPSLGRALAEMVLYGGSKFSEHEEFHITRKNADGSPILRQATVKQGLVSKLGVQKGQRSGSSRHSRVHHIGH